MDSAKFPRTLGKINLISDQLKTINAELYSLEMLDPELSDIPESHIREIITEYQTQMNYMSRLFVKSNKM